MIENLLRADLVIIDEVGFAPLDDTGAQLLFRFATACERRAPGRPASRTGGMCRRSTIGSSWLTCTQLPERVSGCVAPTRGYSCCHAASHLDGGLTTDLGQGAVGQLHDVEVVDR